MFGDLEYFESEDFKEILHKYEESVKSGERIYMDADDLTDIADYYLYKGKKDEAHKAIELAQEYDPEALCLMLFKAREAMEKGDFATAEQYVTKVEAVDETEAVYLRADIMIRKEAYDEADKMLEDYLNILPEEDQKEFAEGVIGLYIDSLLLQKALNWIKRYGVSNIDTLKDYTARVLLGMGEYKKSEIIFNELLDKNPFSADYWNALAETQYMKEDYNQALTSVNYALAINPDNEISQFSKASILEAMENFDEALKYFKQFSKKSPDNEACYMHQALCYIGKGDNKKALKLLEKAIGVADEDSVCLPEIYREMALLHSGWGHVEKALECIDMTDKLECDHHYFDVIRGHVLLSNHQDKEAERIFDKVLKESENNAELKLKIIISYMDNKHLTYAYNAFVEFFKNEGADLDQGYSYMAICCNDLMKKDEFLYYIKKACDCNPEEAKTVLSGFFPEDMDTKDYYGYALEHCDD